MEKVEGVKKKSKRKESRYGKRYGFEVKLRCVKLRLEEGVHILEGDCWVRWLRKLGGVGIRILKR
jgi:hypothetical protein